jgi:hypothetical protein
VRPQGVLSSRDPYLCQEYCIHQQADALLSFCRLHGFLHLSLEPPPDGSSAHDLFNGTVQARLRCGPQRIPTEVPASPALASAGRLSVVGLSKLFITAINCSNEQPEVGPACATVW